MKYYYLSAYLSAITLFSSAQFPKPVNLAEVQQEYRQAVARRDTPAIAEAAYLMGKRYRGLGDYVASRRWLLACLKLREPRGPSVELNKLYVQLAGDFPGGAPVSEAFRYAHLAVANSRKLNHLHSLMSAYNLAGSLHWSVSQGGQGRIYPAPTQAARQIAADSALWYYQRAESIAYRLGKPLDIAASRITKANVLISRDPQRAIALYTTALQFYERARHANSININLILADIHLSVGQKIPAKNHLIAADNWIRQLKNIDVHLPAKLQRNWADWHRAAGNWQLAYEYRQRADSLNELARMSEQRSKIAQLNAAYAADQREAELKAQRAELTLNQNHLAQQKRQTIAAWALFVFAGLTGLWLYRLSRENKRISIRNAQLADELNHRMSNNFQAISGMLGLQARQVTDLKARQAVQASQARVQTMAFLHQKLYDPNRLVSLGLSMVITEVVSDVLESYGFSSIEPVFNLEEVPIQSNQAVPIALILNEVITNACKYAFPNQPMPSLHVGCWREENTLHLRIADNGPGMKEPSSGFGLYLVKLLVGQLGGKFTISGRSGVTFDLWAEIKEKTIQPAL